MTSNLARCAEVLFELRGKKREDQKYGNNSDSMLLRNGHIKGAFFF